MPLRRDRDYSAVLSKEPRFAQMTSPPADQVQYIEAPNVAYEEMTTRVGEVMTRSVVSISPVWGIETAAAIMQNRRIRRLPVVHDGRLVGIVTRADLIKALATEVGRSPKGGA